MFFGDKIRRKTLPQAINSGRCEKYLSDPVKLQAFLWGREVPVKLQAFLWGRVSPRQTPGFWRGEGEALS